MPRNDDPFDQMRRAKAFLRIDFRSGYHQERINDEVVHKTSFKTIVISRYLDNIVLAFLGDIIIVLRMRKVHEGH